MPDKNKYTLIYADPAWRYSDSASDGKRGAQHKYPVMTLEDLKRLPVWDLAADSCLLAMWWVPPMPQEALDLVKAWGFRLMTMKGFSWHKIHEKSGKDCMGMGHMTRGNSEDVLFAVKGKLPKRADASIIQWLETEAGTFTAPRGEHSAKPEEVALALEKLLGDVPRIELFSRTQREGWHTWGNQCECHVQLVPGEAVTVTPWSGKPAERCPYCDGTGDVHRADGEWLGVCTCGKPADWDDDLDGEWSPDDSL